MNGPGKPLDPAVWWMASGIAWTGEMTPLSPYRGFPEWFRPAYPETHWMMYDTHKGSWKLGLTSLGWKVLADHGWMCDLELSWRTVDQDALWRADIVVRNVTNKDDVSSFGACPVVSPSVLARLGLEHGFR